jgi:hypothetical protein
MPQRLTLGSAKLRLDDNRSAESLRYRDRHN